MRKVAGSKDWYRSQVLVVLILLLLMGELVLVILGGLGKHFMWKDTMVLAMYE